MELSCHQEPNGTSRDGFEEAGRYQPTKSVGDTIQKRVSVSRLAATNALGVHGFVAVFGQIRSLSGFLRVPLTAAAASPIDVLASRIPPFALKEPGILV
jgi:hypothetical protein